MKKSELRQIIREEIQSLEELKTITPEALTKRTKNLNKKLDALVKTFANGDGDEIRQSAWKVSSLYDIWISEVFRLAHDRRT